jgi:hypothetical protein
MGIDLNAWLPGPENRPMHVIDAAPVNELLRR